MKYDHTNCPASSFIIRTAGSAHLNVLHHHHHHHHHHRRRRRPSRYRPVTVCSGSEF